MTAGLEDVRVPAAVESEAAYLGCLLLGAASALRLLPAMEAEDFVVPVHQTVLAAARALVDRGEPVDTVTVLGELRRGGQAVTRLTNTEVGIALVQIGERTPIPMAGRSYAVDVLDAAVRRRIAEMGNRLQRLADKSDLDNLVRLVGTEATAVRALVVRRQQIAESGRRVAA